MIPHPYGLHFLHAAQYDCQRLAKHLYKAFEFECIRNHLFIHCMYIGQFFAPIHRK